jgi:hypothetical protein
MAGFQQAPLEVSQAMGAGGALKALKGAAQAIKTIKPAQDFKLTMEITSDELKNLLP